MRFFIISQMCVLVLLSLSKPAIGQIKIPPNSGPSTVCKGTIEHFSSGYDKAGSMSWAVSGDAEIVTVNGLDITGLKADLGLTVHDKLQYVFAEVCNWSGTLKGSFKLATGGTKQADLSAILMRILVIAKH